MLSNYTTMLKSERRKLGTFFTKSEVITSYMTKRLELSPNLLILEPCAGDGEFIKALKKTGLNLNIKAFEIDKKCVIHLKKEFKDISTENKNTLFDINKDEFDRIIGNPPYGAKINKEESDFYNKTYPEINTTESYALFLVNCIKRLKPKGILSFIISDTFLCLNNHKKLRKFMLENCKIKEIVLLKSRLFPQLFYQYAGLCIITLEKGKCNDKHTLRFVNRLCNIKQLKKLAKISLKETPSFVESELIPQKDYKRFIDNVFFQAGISKRLLTLFIDGKRTIGELVECKTGIYSGDNKRHFALLEGTKEAERYSNSGYKTIPKQEIIKRKLTKEEKTQGIRKKPYFVPLMKGGAGNYCKKTPWAVDWSTTSVGYMKKDPKARVQNSSYYFKEGICMSLINSNRQHARLIEYGIFDQSDNGYFCDKKHLYFFLAFFNSKIFNYLLKKIINPTANATVNYVKKVPIILPRKKTLEEINKAVEKIIIKIKQKRKYGETQKKLDCLFYTAYNLSENEIETVENFNYHNR